MSAPIAIAFDRVGAAACKVFVAPTRDARGEDALRASGTVGFECEIAQLRERPLPAVVADRSNLESVRRMKNEWQDAYYSSGRVVRQQAGQWTEVRLGSEARAPTDPFWTLHAARGFTADTAATLASGSWELSGHIDLRRAGHLTRDFGIGALRASLLRSSSWERNIPAVVELEPSGRLSSIAYSRATAGSVLWLRLDLYAYGDVSPPTMPTL
ncbi:MAG TPA: hypothetical protein VK501_03720 [Baekduia sp.]|uniref:hypothetical protein n=1 Tax=Baekduia sp. TaxID=2600305 RepID=UPI002D17B7B6|nr:hypothetical protein [Baekduia sp.]HMJ33003.1 hypothetical protein [Baekduia sp.]